MRHGERGAAMVEFTLTAAMFLTFVFVILELGRALYAYDLIGQAVRAGTRYAIVNAAPCAATGITTTCEDAVKDKIKASLVGIDQAQMTGPTFTWQSASPPQCGGTAQPGCTVAIEIDYKFTSIALPFATPTFKSSSAMVVAP